MPTIEENLQKWDGDYHWNTGGDNWSQPWGTTEMQWYGAILPRIHNFLPTGTILEIAPGFGRWTRYLKDQCHELIVVDLSARCIEACKKRFAHCGHIRYHVNDGQSLDFVADRSVDFVFSFDSLVHAEEQVIASYVQQLAHKLKPHGVGFLHHSNVGQYAGYLRTVRKNVLLRGLCKLLGLETSFHGRGQTVTAQKFAALAASAGLHCNSQELINWRSHLLVDCLTVITPQDSRWVHEIRRLRNPHFMREAQQIARLAPLYSMEKRAA